MKKGMAWHSNKKSSEWENNSLNEIKRKPYTGRKYFQKKMGYLFLKIWLSHQEKEKQPIRKMGNRYNQEVDRGRKHTARKDV